MTRRAGQMAVAQAALLLLAAEGLAEDTRRLGQPEGWQPQGASSEPWKRKRKNRDSNGPGGPKVKLRIPRGRP